MFLNLRMPDGTTHRLEALDGWRVMEVIRDWGLPIKAEELDGLEIALAPESLADAPVARVAVGG